MSSLVPMWILGGPFIGLLILGFAFKGQSSMGGTLPRTPPREGWAVDPSAPLFDPMHPDAPRRLR